MNNFLKHYANLQVVATHMNTLVVPSEPVSQPGSEAARPSVILLTSDVSAHVPTQLTGKNRVEDHSSQRPGGGAIVTRGLWTATCLPHKGPSLGSAEWWRPIAH